MQGDVALLGRESSPQPLVRRPRLDQDVEERGALAGGKHQRVMLRNRALGGFGQGRQAVIR